MAGERYASITIQAAISHDDDARGTQMFLNTFTLAGRRIDIQLGGNPGQVTAPDPDDVGEQYAHIALQNLVNVLSARIYSLGLPYVVTGPRDAGQVPDPIDSGQQVTVQEITITATSYGYNLNPDWQNIYDSKNWTLTQRVANISPVYATAAVTNTGLYGSADGAITVTVTGGYGAGTSIAWTDGSANHQRTNLKAGFYTFTVTDIKGATYTATVQVQSDPEFVVEVATTPNSIALLARGGVAPYAYAWADGASGAASATRLGLPAGTYACTVTDAHGATRYVEVVLSASDRYWFSGNPITLSLDAGPAYRLDPTTKPGLGFVCQVFVELGYLSGEFTQVGQDLEQPADAAGRTTFEVQELLEPFVEPVLPAVNQAAVQRVEGTFRRFYLKHFERTADGDGAVATVDTNYLVHGGLSYREAAAGTWFSSYQFEGNPFLTWEPARKKVLPDQPEFLYFMMPAAAGTTFHYRLRATLADGSLLDVVLADRAGVLAGEVFCLPAGPAQLALAARAAGGSPVTQYQVNVEDDNGSSLSETRVFVLDRRPCPVRRYFLYANSLGGWNTLVCRGRAALELATQTTASDNPRAAGYDPLRGDYTISRRTGLPTLHCYTGPRSARQLLADQDFLLSERVLLVENGHYLAGQVKDRTTTVYDEDETRRVVQFDYELPRERYYTPTLTA